MRTTQIHCSRCGDVILGGHSIIEAKHGELSARHDEPIDLLRVLCGSIPGLA
jgi:ribosomal protein S27AE